MVFVVDQKFVDMWAKHCDTLSLALTHNFMRFENYVKEHVVFKGFDINYKCSCKDVRSHIGKFTSEFLDFDHIITFEFRGYGKKEVALRIKVHFDYERDILPFCFNLMEVDNRFYTKQKIALKCSNYNYLLQVLEGCNMRFEFEIIDLNLQNLLAEEVLNYMMKKAMGDMPYRKSNFEVEKSEWKEYVL